MNGKKAIQFAAYMQAYFEFAQNTSSISSPDTEKIKRKYEELFGSLEPKKENNLIKPGVYNKPIPDGSPTESEDLIK